MLFVYKKEETRQYRRKLKKRSICGNLIMEDTVQISGHERGFDMEEKHKSAHNSSGDDESVACRDEVLVVKVGRKRAHHEMEDLNSSLSENNKDLSNTKQIIAASDKERSAMESDSKASSSSQKDQDNSWLESARAEMGEVREENQRLKMYLSKMMKDYEALQLQFYEIMQQEEAKKSKSTADYHQEVEEPELVSLSLGRFSSESKRDVGKCSQGKEEEDEKAKGLSLGLKWQFESKSDANEPNNLQNPSPVNIFEEPKEEAGETWPPNKPPNDKTVPSGEEEAVQQNPLKKARVCVRARCDTPTMNDGCQWRKYGQKIAKGNPCPRAYYRCTVAPSCPVRKQVQRCADDMSILITTYEGTHNHPLPLSATAMASTTSAAASMLLSGSSSSSTSRTAAATTPADLHGLNFYLSDSSNSKQFYFQNSSLSASTSHPTITLDLTSHPSSSSHNFNRFSTSNYSQVPKFGPTSLNFSSAESNPVSWCSNGFLSYGNTNSQPYNRTQIGALNVSRPTTENNLLNSYMQKKTPAIPQQDTIAAATKAITSDPSFQSALAAALTSIIGTGGGGGAGAGGGANVSNLENFAQKLKWGEHFPVASSGYSSQTTKANACATSYMNKTTTNFQGGSLMFLPPSLPVSSPKSSASASPGDNRDQNN